MDTIEKSNLSRQFLFRDADVGKFKSAAAEEAIQRLNSRVQMDTHTSKVGEESALKETYFDDNFWAEGVDVVMNALDNVEARLFMDSMCVANRKAMIDAGTLGAKGNVQVVVPCQSESYGSSADPPEPTIAVCTLKVIL
jgi:ubiquitin-activating enzyme E1